MPRPTLSVRPSLGPPCHALWGHLPALRRDPLGFLTRCAQGDTWVVPLRLPGVRAFVLLDPDDIERVLVTDHRDFVKPPWLRTAAVRRLLGDGLVTSDGDPWRRQRRACQPAFHPGRLPGYGQTVAALAERTLAGWHAGQVRDIPHDMARLTLEVVTQTLLGVDGAGRAGPISAAMDTLMRGFSAPHSLFGLRPRFPTPCEAGATRRLDRLVDGLINDGQRHIPDGPPTLLSRCVAAPDAGEPPEGDRQTHRRRREQVKTFLAAGHESSALGLTWAFLLLDAHPEADARLDDELRTVLGDRPPTPDDLPHLPYTQAIVQETLRLYPPLWMTGRRAVRRCEIGGQRVPAGSVLLLSPWAVQRHPSLFADPDAFQPERWTDPAAVAARPRFAFFPFGGGPRVCIGQGFAQMETALLLAAVARRFRLELLPDSPSLRPWATMTLRPPAGLRMRLRARVAS